MVAETVNIRIQPAGVAYMVTWTYRGQRELIDCDSEHLAGTIAVLLRESGREDVAVTQVPYERDPERAARVRKRIAERLAGDGVDMGVFG